MDAVCRVSLIYNTHKAGSRMRFNLGSKGWSGKWGSYLTLFFTSLLYLVWTWRYCPQHTLHYSPSLCPWSKAVLFYLLCACLLYFLQNTRMDQIRLIILCFQLEVLEWKDNWITSKHMKQVSSVLGHQVLNSHFLGWLKTLTTKY